MSIALTPRRRLIFALLLPALLLGQATSNSRRYKVAAEPLVGKPASPLLASHFVELGYGFQVEPMMA